MGRTLPEADACYSAAKSLFYLPRRCLFDTLETSVARDPGDARPCRAWKHRVPDISANGVKLWFVGFAATSIPTCLRIEAPHHPLHRCKIVAYCLSVKARSPAEESLIIKPDATDPLRPIQRSVRFHWSSTSTAPNFPVSRSKNTPRNSKYSPERFVRRPKSSIEISI